METLVINFGVISLFVFSIGGSKQNVKSFWTPVSESVFYALSHGSLGFALHGSFFNHFLIGWFSSTANKILWNKRSIRLPWRTKCRLPCERAWETVSETCFNIEFTFCLRPPIEKTNSGQSINKCPLCSLLILVMVNVKWRRLPRIIGSLYRTERKNKPEKKSVNK